MCKGDWSSGMCGFVGLYRLLATNGAVLVSNIAIGVEWDDECAAGLRTVVCFYGEESVIFI